MKRVLLWTVVLAMLASCQSTSADKVSELKIDPGGYGPFRLGMNIEAAFSLLGLSVPYPVLNEEGACYSHWRNGNYENPDDVRFLFLDGVLALIDIWVPHTLTPENVGVGSRQETVRETYEGQFRVDGDHYDSNVSHIFVKLVDSPNVYRFTYAQTGLVNEVRVGTPSNVTLVEGCG